MIKLIATDMDGTLLNKERKVPEGVFEVVEELHQKGILFVAASGRSLKSLEGLFEPVKGYMGFVSENGTVVELYGEELELQKLPQEHLPKMIEFLNQGVSYPIINSKHNAYILPRINLKYERIQSYCANFVSIDNITLIPDDVVSISIFIENGQPLPIYEELVQKWGNDAVIVVSGEFWIDIIPKGVNKGTGLQILMKKLGITKEEVMAFGDFNNDIEMLALANESYAMSHANDNVKAVAKFECTPEQILDVIKNSYK